MEQHRRKLAEQAGAKVQAASAEIADKIIQEKAFSQTSQVFENRELMNEYADRLMNDTGTHTVKDPDGTERQVTNGYSLRTGNDKVSPDDFETTDASLSTKFKP